MNRRFDLKIIVFFAVLTLLLTIGVIAFWEGTLRPPFYAWVDARYPGDANAERRWNVKQRVEHVFISLTVDAMVVTLLLRVVHRQQRQLQASEERYRALFEQARDGIGVVRLSGGDAAACRRAAASRARAPPSTAAARSAGTCPRAGSSRRRALPPAAANPAAG